jgi:hypothetical protein
VCYSFALDGQDEKEIRETTRAQPEEAIVAAFVQAAAGAGCVARAGGAGGS